MAGPVSPRPSLADVIARLDRTEVAIATQGRDIVKVRQTLVELGLDTGHHAPDTDRAGVDARKPWTEPFGRTPDFWVAGVHPALFAFRLGRESLRRASLPREGPWWQLFLLGIGTGLLLVGIVNIGLQAAIENVLRPDATTDDSVVYKSSLDGVPDVQIAAVLRAAASRLES